MKSLGGDRTNPSLDGEIPSVSPQLWASVPHSSTAGLRFLPVKTGQNYRSVSRGSSPVAQCRLWKGREGEGGREREGGKAQGKGREWGARNLCSFSIPSPRHPAPPHPTPGVQGAVPGAVGKNWRCAGATRTSQALSERALRRQRSRPGVVAERRVNRKVSESGS